MFVKSLFLLAAFSLAKKPCKQDGIPYAPEQTNYDHNKQYHRQSQYTTAELNEMAQSMIDTARKDARSLIQTAKAAGKQLVKQANDDAARLKSMANNLDFANEMNQDAQRIYDQAIDAANKKAENQRQRIQALAHQKQLDEQQAMIALQQRQHNMSQINKNLHKNEWFVKDDMKVVPNYRGEVMVRDEGSAVVLRGASFDFTEAPYQLRRRLFDPWVIIIIIIFLTVENLVLNALGTDENLVSYVMGLINGCKDGKERVRAAATCEAPCTAGSSRQDDGSCANDSTPGPVGAGPPGLPGSRRRLR